jgi:hypothetical protein
MDGVSDPAMMRGREDHMLNKVFVAIMIVGGLLTLTMLYAAFSPIAAVQSMFGETPQGAMANVVVPNWGILIGWGGLLIYGALHAPSRKLALVVAGASKIAFIALVLMQGGQYLSGLGAAVVIDSIMVVLFALYLVFGKPAAKAA